MPEGGGPAAVTGGAAEARLAPSAPERGAAGGGGARSAHPGFWLYAAHLITISGIALSNLFLGLMILWSGWHRRELRRSWSRVAPLLEPLAAYAILLVLSVLGSVDPQGSAGGLREIFSLATLALGVVLVRGERQVRRIFDLLTAVIALLALHGIVQYYFTDYGDLHHRIIGQFSHYQTFAGVLLLGDLLLVARLFRGQGYLWQWPALIAVNWALVLTLTRGAWVAAAVTLAAFGLFCARRLPTTALALALALAVVLALAALAPGPWQERGSSIYDLQDVSNYDRLCMIEAGLRMISESPLLGLGPRMVRERYPLYRHPTAPRFNVPHLHNAFLDVAAERGLLSLAAYFWLFGASLRRTWRAWRREGGVEGQRADLHLGVMLALVAFNIAGLFENNWGDTEVQRVVLFLLAVPCCLDSPAAPASEDAPTPLQPPS